MRKRWAWQWADVDWSLVRWMSLVGWFIVGWVPCCVVNTSNPRGAWSPLCTLLISIYGAPLVLGALGWASFKLIENPPFRRIEESLPDLREVYGED